MEMIFIELLLNYANLKVKGRIYPSTIQSVTLKAHMMDGSIVSGETQIRESQTG